MKAHLIVFSGQGELWYKLVDEENKKWIDKLLTAEQISNQKKGIYSWNEIDICPENTKKYNEQPDQYELSISTGATSNDRQLYAAPLGGDIFYSMKDLQKYIKDNKIEVVSEDTACIY